MELTSDDETLTQDYNNFQRWSLSCLESICELHLQLLGLTGTRQRPMCCAPPGNARGPATRPKMSLSIRQRRAHLIRSRILLYCMMVTLVSWNVPHRTHAFQPLCVQSYVSTRDAIYPSILQAKMSSSAKGTSIKEVQPQTSSTREKRLSVQEAWKQANSLAVDSSKDRQLSSTPYLDLFTRANSSVTNFQRDLSQNQQPRVRPRGRPDSVPGAMSRATLLSLNEVKEDVHSMKITNNEFSIDAKGSPLSTPKRGRGRPRKNSNVNHGVVDEVTSIAATAATSADPFENQQFNVGGEITPPYSDVEEDDTIYSNKSRRSREKILPKSRKLKESEKEEETTGMMPSGKSRKNGETDSPNLQLQRYYRTPLLTQEDEYSLGMKIQFLMKCEQVHEGLYQVLGRAPTIVEWANACGFKEEDPVRCSPNYQETDLETQLRPVKSEAWDDDHDPNMFIGNGLAHDSGPGRGRGRAKKTPPTSLKDYYDDSDTRFGNEKSTLRKRPINRGTPQDFVDMMLIGKEAKQKMVQSNMRLVVSISKRYKHVGVNVADLVQEGSIGLTRAAEKFDPKKGFKFSTYASWWIQQAVFRSIAYHSRTIRLPVHVHNLLNRVRRVRSELKRLYGRSPTNEEMAAELNMSVDKFVKMLRLTRKAISLDIAKYQNNPKDIGQESETSLGDTIDAAEVIKDESTPQETVDRSLFRDDLNEMLQILGDDERAVICARYGINDGLTRTVTTVAAQLGQTKSWVRSQECRALRKLRRPWYEKRLWEHQNSLRG